MNSQQIDEQRNRGFRLLKFQPSLERAYQHYQWQRLRSRLPLVNICALIFFLIYSVVDYVILPHEVASWSIPIRLALICPTILIATWVGLRTRSRHLFLTSYSLSFLLACLAVIVIIYIAHSKGVMLPYDGLFLMLMYGYFVMAIPCLLASCICWLIFAAYVLVELAAGAVGSELYLNSFFLAGANLIGTIGAYVQEYATREGFLNLQQVKAQKRKADKENRAKTRFFAAASHDLRQPLNALNLLLESALLQTRPDIYTDCIGSHQASTVQSSPAATEDKEVLYKMKGSLRQLNAQFRALLDISRLSLGVMSPKPEHFNINRRLRTLLAELDSEYGSGPEIVTRMPASLVTHADPLFFDRILRNLLVNAVKHAEAQHIEVRVEQEEAFARVTVTDDGKGIPSSEKKRVFLEFIQGSQSGEGESGMGLGLPIVAQLIRLSGGELTMCSPVPDGEGNSFFALRSQRPGTSFTFTLPLGDIAEVAEPATKEPMTAPLGLVGKIIWLFEDEDANAHALQNLLEQQGCQTVHLPSFSHKAIESAPFPDIILSDYHLADRDNGIAAIRRSRDVLRSQVPAILISADVDLIRQLNGASAEIVVRDRMLYLSKPLVPAKLLLAMRHLLQQQHGQKPGAAQQDTSLVEV